MKHTLLLVLALLALPAAQAQEVFQFSAARGSYGVGLQIVQQYDPARSFKGGKRPIQTLVWYPAQAGGQPIRYGDYLQTIGSADDFTRTPAEQKQVMERIIHDITDGKRDAQIAFAREQAMWAVMDAKPIPGKFPIVIYAPSFSADAFQNADLCEYLASHGYIVLASPALGAEKRNTSFSVAGVELQAADLRFLLDYAASLPQADSSRTAVIGYSWGGLAAVFAAAKDGRIKALVQLDGSVRYLNKLVEQAGYVNGASVTVPMIYFAHYPDSLESLLEYKQDMTGSLINQMKAADLYLFNMNGLDHVNFSSWFFRSRDLAAFDNYTPQEASLAYSWVARYSLEFLNAYLKGETSAKAFLKARPESHGVPAHFMRASIRREGQNDSK